MKKLLRFLLIVVSYFSCLISYSSCTQDAYEKGEGEYSLMRGDLAEAHTDMQKQIDYIVTDDGDRLRLTNQIKPSWSQTADTLYRCMLYYNKVEGKTGSPMAEVLSIGQVPCPRFRTAEEVGEVKTDPVKFGSIWRSRSGRYVNLRFQLLTGSVDDTAAVHQLALITDTIEFHHDGGSTRRIRLHHDRHDRPEYYSTEVFLSIPSDSIAADSLSIVINTYEGLVTKTIKR